MANKALIPAVQKDVVFYEDTIVAVRMEDGQVYVPIRPMCDNLGVTLAGQRERINRDPVLAEVATSVSVTLTQQARGMICLPLKFIPGWLFGINANRVKPELRDRIIRYQRECFDVLSEAFNEGRLTFESNFSDLLANDTPATQAYKMASAIMKMAQQQIMLEAQLETHASKIVDHEQRLEEIEATLGDPGRAITPDQAMQISQGVKAVAIAYGKQTNRNEFGAIYGELYRKEGVTSYKQLPAHRFETVMKWLGDWYQDVTGEADFPF